MQYPNERFHFSLKHNKWYLLKLNQRRVVSRKIDWFDNYTFTDVKFKPHAKDRPIIPKAKRLCFVVDMWRTFLLPQGDVALFTRLLDIDLPNFDFGFTEFRSRFMGNLIKSPENYTFMNPKKWNKPLNTMDSMWNSVYPRKDYTVEFNT